MIRLRSEKPLIKALRALLRISFREASFARRRFARGAPETVQHLEGIGRSFLFGYNAAIVAGEPRSLTAQLIRVPKADMGFAVEGAAFAFALLDGLFPSRLRRFDALLNTASEHIYMAHVGAGWGIARLKMARLGLARQRAFARMDPLLRWLAIDGYGFHEGFFRPERTIYNQWQPKSTGSYLRRAFDQGLGRSLWFSECAHASSIRAKIHRFPEDRRADLWSGAGLACTYAGGVSEEAILALARDGAEYRPQLAQGAAFAVKARLRARNLVEHSVRACRVLCGTDVETAAAITDKCLTGVSDRDDIPAYEQWRQRTAAHFVETSIQPAQTA